MRLPGVDHRTVMRLCPICAQPNGKHWTVPHVLMPRIEQERRLRWFALLVVHPPHDRGAAFAVHPDSRPIHTGLQLAAPAVVQVEGVQLDQQGHGRERSAAARRPRAAARRRSASRRRHADPPPPAVLGDGPVLLLDRGPPPVGPPSYALAGSFATQPSYPRWITCAHACTPSGASRRTRKNSSLPATTSSSRARRSRSCRPVRSRRSWYSRSKAIRSGGVATASGSGSRIPSNRDRSCWS
jgi:hypothetical protein